LRALNQQIPLELGHGGEHAMIILPAPLVMSMAPSAGGERARPSLAIRSTLALQINNVVRGRYNFVVRAVPEGYPARASGMAARIWVATGGVARSFNFWAAIIRGARGFDSLLLRER
jgi:hypothetical protein